MSLVLKHNLDLKLKRENSALLQMSKAIKRFFLEIKRCKLHRFWKAAKLLGNICNPKKDTFYEYRLGVSHMAQ